MQDTEGQMIRFKASKKEFKEKTQSIEERKIELEETTSQIQVWRYCLCSLVHSNFYTGHNTVLNSD